MSGRCLRSLVPLAGAAVLASLAWADARGPVAPPFPSADPAHWIGTPQSWDALRGRVVLLDVWTFG